MPNATTTARPNQSTDFDGRDRRLGASHMSPTASAATSAIGNIALYLHTSPAWPCTNARAARVDPHNGHHSPVAACKGHGVTHATAPKAAAAATTVARDVR